MKTVWLTDGSRTFEVNIGSEEEKRLRKDGFTEVAGPEGAEEVAEQKKPPAEPTAKELERLKLDDLKKMAEEKGLTVTEGVTKAVLIKALTESESLE